MRIIAGTHRGHRIAAPKGRETRPTSDRVRENAFNLIGPVDGSEVLDLFAGSGALGIEALSRGAAAVTFVDRQERGLAILRQNLDALGFKARAQVVRGDVVRWLEASSDAVRAADVVFLDPPYGDVVLDRALRALDSAVGDAVVVAEHSRRQAVPPLTRLQVDRERRYGDTIVTVLRS